MEKFFALQKFDERSGTVYGIMTCSEPDKGGEIFDYDGGGKADVQRWSDEAVASTRAAGQEISLGNIRLMHGLEIAGKAIQIDYDDNSKKIGLLSQPVDDKTRDMCRNGFVRGYSIAGGYKSRNCDQCGGDMMGEGNDCPQCGQRVLVRFVPRIVECSYVDNPCVPSATFQYVKADGSMELRKFSKEGKDMSLKEHFTRAAGHNEKLAKLHADLAAVHDQAGNRAAAKIEKGIADTHKAHAAHCEQMATESVDGGEKLAKASSVAEDFFSKFVYGSAPMPMPRQSADGGLFSK